MYSYPISHINLSSGEDLQAEEQKWTCKKCTLVNSDRSLICEACYGSKLRSVSTNNDMTLKKGEFWSCSKCTLKNSLNVSACKACKSEKVTLEVITRSKSPSPRHGRSKRQSKVGSSGSISSSANGSGPSSSSSSSTKSQNAIRTVQQEVPIERGSQRVNLRSDLEQSKLRYFSINLESLRKLFQMHPH